MLPLSASRLGRAYALSGRVDEGETLLQQAAERVSEISEDACRATWLGEACLLSSRIEDAARLARWSLERATTGSERRSAAWAVRLLGEVALCQETPKFDEAERHYQQALALATELGMLPLVAHCHLGLGTLYRRTGDPAKAEEHLASATAMYREMDMGFWQEQAEAARGAPHRKSP